MYRVAESSDVLGQPCLTSGFDEHAVGDEPTSTELFGASYVGAVLRPHPQPSNAEVSAGAHGHHSGSRRGRQHLDGDIGGVQTAHVQSMLLYTTAIGGCR